MSQEKIIISATAAETNKAKYPDTNNKSSSPAEKTLSTSDDKEKDNVSKADKKSLADDQEQRKYSQVQKTSLIENTASSQKQKNPLLNDTNEGKLTHEKANDDAEEEKTSAEETKKNVTLRSVEEIPCVKKIVPQLGAEQSADDNAPQFKTEKKQYPQMTDQSKQSEDSQAQMRKFPRRASESFRRERTFSIPVGVSSGEIRHSIVLPNRKYSKAADKVISSEYVVQSVEVLEALPIPDKKASKSGSEGAKPDPRYSSIIEELEAQKEKTIIEKSLERRTSASAKKLRFGEEEMPRRETDILSLPKGMRLEYRACPKTCEKFLHIEEFASLFVDDIIQEALIKGKIIRKVSSTKIVEGIEYKDDSDDSDDSLSIPSVGTYVCVFEWPTIEEFTIPLGASKITEYFSYWKFDEDWKYCVNYLKGESDAASDFYRYETIFSIPCRQYPIPQATASVYFTFAVSRVRPKHCLVDAYYSFEGHRLVHTPGQFKLQESWLFHIIDAKINFYKTLTF